MAYLLYCDTDACKDLRYMSADFSICSSPLAHAGLPLSHQLEPDDLLILSAGIEGEI